jgi:hypothetical protein
VMSKNCYCESLLLCHSEEPFALCHSEESFALCHSEPEGRRILNLTLRSFPFTSFRVRMTKPRGFNPVASTLKGRGYRWWQRSRLQETGKQT